MIDYGFLNDANIFYENRGFQRIEVPWLVTEAVDSITRPVGVEPYVVPAKKKNLIASGEQGFLYLYLKEYLPKGSFQTTTPCFRNDSFDFTHTKYFMKNELIKTDKTSKYELERLVELCCNHFQHCFDKELTIIPTLDGYDINIDDYELGSYGIRECEFLKWIYGTGWAEPRMSKLITLYQKNKL